jgi:hypothetical protein
MESGALHQSFLSTECESDRTRRRNRDRRIAPYRAGGGNHLRLRTGISGLFFQERLPLPGMRCEDSAFRSTPTSLRQSRRVARSGDTECRSRTRPRTWIDNSTGPNLLRGLPSAHQRINPMDQGMAEGSAALRRCLIELPTGRAARCSPDGSRCRPTTRCGSGWSDRCRSASHPIR